MNFMPAGKLKHRIQIQRSTPTTNPLGESIESWSPLVTVWAYVKAMSGRELISAKQIHAQATHRVDLRFLEGLDSTDRFVFEGRTFNFLFVDDMEEAGRNMTCLAEERK